MLFNLLSHAISVYENAIIIKKGKLKKVYSPTLDTRYTLLKLPFTASSKHTVMKKKERSFSIRSIGERNENDAASIITSLWVKLFFQYSKVSGFFNEWFENVQGKSSSSGSEMQVTWEDQQNINTFSRLNNRFHELEDDIKLAKVPPIFSILPKTSILGVLRLENRMFQRVFD